MTPTTHTLLNAINYYGANNEHVESVQALANLMAAVSNPETIDETTLADKIADAQIALKTLELMHHIPPTKVRDLAKTKIFGKHARLTVALATIDKTPMD